MANILEVKDLCKTYVIDKRQNNVLRNVNFEVEEGDMVAIMGPSGSGKSTLLYSVSGMDVPTSGTVCFAGRDIAKLSQTELAKVRLDEMGFIFQQMYMMKNLTILDNILLPAMESKKDERSRAEKVAFAEELMRKLSIIHLTKAFSCTHMRYKKFSIIDNFFYFCIKIDNLYWNRRIIFFNISKYDSFVINDYYELTFRTPLIMISASEI